MTTAEHPSRISVTDGARLLVVDDNEMNRDVLSRRLKRRGFSVDVAADGPSALAFVEENPYDLVLLDINMPGMSGLEVLSVIRESHSIAELPVVMTTANKESDMVVEALSIGANDYLTKPINFPVFLARIETQLRLRVPRDRQSGNFRNSGEFHTLKKTGEIKLMARKVYCEQCGTCQADDASQCTECDAPRPLAGWALINASEYPYLGKTVSRRYFFERFVGAGATGSVYRARDLDLKRKFAAKVVDLRNDVRGTARQRLEAEVEALASLTNPHVVKIYEVAQLKERTFALIMDYVEGRTLGEILETVGPLEPWLALDVVRQVAQGLHEVHQASMIHRDVKPDNIMLEKLPAGGYHAKVLDFGVVKGLGAMPADNHAFLGTPLYMSPEHIRDDLPVDHRADIYSLGACLYHILIGMPPYMDDTVYRILTRQLKDPVPSVVGVMDGPGVEEINQIIQKMMAKKADERYASLTDVIKAIDAVLPVLSPARENLHLDKVKRPNVVDGAQATLVSRDTPGVKSIFRSVRWTRHHQVTPALSANYQLLCVKALPETCHIVFLDFPNGKARKIEGKTDGLVSFTALSSDGTFAALYSADVEKGWIIDIEQGRIIKRFKFPEPVVCIAIADDGSAVAGASAGGVTYVVDDGGGIAAHGNKGVAATCIAFSRRASELAVGYADKTLRVLPIRPEGLKSRLPTLPFIPTQVCFNSVGDVGAVLGENKHISLFLPMGGTIVNQMEFAFDPVMTINYDRRNRLICVEATDQKLRLWDIQRLFEEAVGQTTVIKLKQSV